LSNLRFGRRRTNTSTEFDGIILGAGHNSLILQAYLGRAGLKVVCLERRDIVGGGLTTVENPRNPGFLHNTHSFFHRGISYMPWYRDLGLEQRGAVYVEPELNAALVLKNGDVLEWWTDFERTIASFERFSSTDARHLRQWRNDFAPIVENILIPESQSPPIPARRREELLKKTSEGRLLLATSAVSPVEFVLREFEHPVVRGALLFFNGLREVDLRCRGFGHHIPALLAARGKAQMCLGGSAMLARALVSAVLESGGEIRTQVVPRRILAERGRVAGIETASGEVLQARRFVVSGLNPHQTFLELLDEKVLPQEWKVRAGNFRYNLIAPLFALNVSLKEAPHYRAVEKHPHLQNAFMAILGLEGFEQYPEIVLHHERGSIPPTVMWGSCPTLFDTSQAPPNKHVAFMWEKLPYRLRGDPRNWDAEKDGHGRQMLGVWESYAPNLGGALIDWFVQSPLDTERTFPNMKDGDLMIGAFTHGQIGYNRPFAGAGHYRGCLEGLYLCGSSCHPGGNITGLPGYNAAQVILSDLGLSADWAPRPAAGIFKEL
jgi:phytoene dehydrogenase-like protein